MRLRNILEPVSGELDAVELRLSRWAEESTPVAAEAVNHIIRSGGKRLRPACLLFAAKLGPDDAREAVELAAAVEIIHTASLVHDDIIDRAPVRRGSPTIHARWGEGIALLVGDLLYSQTFLRLAERGENEVLRAVSDAVNRMVVGELEETAHRDDLTLKEPDYLRIIGNKTGALFSCATYLGAWAGGLSERERLRPARYGEHLGRAYQMVDDVLDFCEDEKESGKPVGADLREGKVTLPLIHALRAGDGRVEKLFREKDRAGFCAAVLEGGSLSYTVEKVEAAAGEALACLEGVREGPGLRGLAEMGRYVAFRGREALRRSRG